MSYLKTSHIKLSPARFVTVPGPSLCFRTAEINSEIQSNTETLWRQSLAIRVLLPYHFHTLISVRPAAKQISKNH